MVVQEISRVAMHPRVETHCTLVDENLIERMRFVGARGNARLIQTGGATGLVTGIPYESPFLNLVFQKELAARNHHRQIHNLLNAREEPRAPLYWVSDPKLTVRSVQQVLAAHRFGWIEDIWGMSLPLHELGSGNPLPPGLTVRRVAGTQGIADFVRVLCEDREIPGAVQQRWVDLEGRLGTSAGARWQRFIGYLEGEAVATAAVFLGSRSAGVYHVATLPRARGKGIATAVVRAGLEAARDCGYTTGVLMATPMGYNVYRRLGFKTCSTREVYLRWDAAEQ